MGLQNLDKIFFLDIFFFHSYTTHIPITAFLAIFCGIDNGRHKTAPAQVVP
jgi:hypothetical protein